MSRGALVNADATQLFDLARRLEHCDKPIQRAIKGTLTKEVRKVVLAVRKEVLAIPVKTGEGTSAMPTYRARQKAALGSGQGPIPNQQEGVRQAIARGVRSSVRHGSAKRTASIAVVGSSHFLSEDKKVMNRVLNYQEWRHPVFARGGIRDIREFMKRVERLGGRAWAGPDEYSALVEGKYGQQLRVRSWVWVSQKGHPFFGRVTSKYRQPIHDALVKAVEESIQAELRSRYLIGM